MLEKIRLIRSETTTRSEKTIKKERNHLEVKRPFEKGGLREVWVQSRRQLVAEERKCLVMDSEKNERYNKPAAGEQSHDEVNGCLKGGSRNSRGKRLAISMVEEAWLSEKKE
ncbi:hypothetical protein Tco_0227484, partial [Tanacetum coccineum]